MDQGAHTRMLQAWRYPSVPLGHEMIRKSWEMVLKP